MPDTNNKKWTILGQDPDILMAALANILSWFVSTFAPSLLPYLLPSSPEEEPPSFVDETNRARDDDDESTPPRSRTRCVSIGRPGGMEQLRVVSLKEGICTVGYNVRHVCLPPYTPPMMFEGQQGSGARVPPDCVVLRNEAFSVNYADCTIRWGLYESAKKFVGWPIVPGFDVAGVVECAGGGGEEGTESDIDSSDDNRRQGELRVGDRVFGCTLFGAYSTRVLVPKIQLRRIPSCISSYAEAAAFPAVSLTALYALHLAGYSPPSQAGGSRSRFSNKSILIHSAAGGVGSFLVQMSKILGLGPIVGVVGSSSKVDEASSLGCDVVIDKSSEDLWTAAERAGPKEGYATIMDANGVSTLGHSYDHLAPTGRLVIFGFHTNLPVGRAMLSPWEWISMARKASKMPAFDPMDLTVSNKSVLGFNLSFFADEREVLSDLFDQVLMWIEEGVLRCPRVVQMDMDDVGKAHELIQSGKSIGKVVLTTSKGR